MRFLFRFGLALLLSALTLSAPAASEDDDAPAVHHRKKSGSATAKPTPASKKSADPDATPAPKKGADDDDVPVVHHRKTNVPATPTPSPAPKKSTSDPDATPAPKKPSTPDPNVPAATPPPEHAPPVSIASSELIGFEDQPARIKQLIDDALALSRQNLTYKFGSDDPANGGMDCSGTIAYLLRAHGFPEVPRDASGQYTWVRKAGQFFAVNSKKAGGFEFDELRPGDLMFWSGTYAAADRDPPITHTMLYLGVERRRKQQVMWGASDGRSYDGKPRWGVSVFDFRMPKADPASPTGKPPILFLGYGRIPGLREDLAAPPAASKPAPDATPKPKEPAPGKHRAK